MNTSKKPESPSVVRLTAGDVTAARAMRVRSAVRAGITVKQKVTE